MQSRNPDPETRMFQNSLLLEIAEIEPDFTTILTYLDGADLLNLRLVCHKTNSWVEDIKDSKAWDKIQITFRKEEHFEAFVKTGLKIKIPNFYICYLDSWESDKIGKIPYLWEFCEQFSPWIKRLAVGWYLGCVKDAEFQFYNALSSLQELYIGEYYLDEPNFFPPRFPSSFKKLQNLRIQSPWIHIQDYFDLFAFCCHTHTIDLNIFQDENTFENGLEHLMDSVKERERQGEAASQFKTINLKNLQFANPEEMTRDFLNFVEFCFLRGIKLDQVDAELICGAAALEAPVSLKKAVDQSVLSLKGFTPNCLQFGWDNLEEIVLTPDSSQAKFPLNFDPPKFPKLRSIFFHYDLNPNLMDERKRNYEQFKLDVFFPENSNVAKTEVKNLTILDQCFTNEAPMKVSRILQNVPNLKSLKMKEWNGNSQEWAALFIGFPNLEELTVLSCGSFNDEALFGEDPRNPVFLKLIRLRKFYLRISKSSQRLSSRAFKEVFAKMTLKTFIIDTISKITKEEIAALKNGAFGTSIRKFSCFNLSLKDVTPDPYPPPPNELIPFNFIS